MTRVGYHAHKLDPAIQYGQQLIDQLRAENEQLRKRIDELEAAQQEREPAAVHVARSGRCAHAPANNP